MTGARRIGGSNAPAARATVAMPTYRRLAYALDALDSILAQETGIPFEILVLDNAIQPELEQAAFVSRALAVRLLEEIGRVMGLSRERVRQIEATALKKIQAAEESHDLREFLAVE